MLSDVPRRSLVALLLSTPALGLANPADPTVVHGSADFSGSGSVLEVRNSPGAIIDWGAFSIGEGEVTRFIQESVDSAVLNRVVGTDGSLLAGELASNGRVFLLNPNGIVFGDGAVIDTAGFVASTLEMTDEDFLAGDLRLAGESGRIVNAGMLRTRGGNVFFVAPDIENSGIVHAEDGSLILAAGREVRIASLDEAGVEVLVQAPEDRVLNLGELVADRGAVRALAGTIEHSGAIEATGVSRDADGAIVLHGVADVTLAAGSRVVAAGADGGDIDVRSDEGTVLVEGLVDASGDAGFGGRVRVLGERVGLVGDARIDATGTAGGGEVLLGGNQEGLGPEPNAARTFVGADARIDASATSDGDGGRIISFSSDETRVFGALVARGGVEGGDGGFIETSGGVIQVTRTPDAGADVGAPGDWLIDPDLVVIAGDATVNSEITPSTGAGGEDVFSGDPAGAANSLIGDVVIESSLQAGTSVIVRTGQTADSIIVDAPIDLAVTTPGLSLDFDANQDIVVNAPIRNVSETPIDIGFSFGFGAEIAADVITATNFGGTISFLPVEGGRVDFAGSVLLGGDVSSASADLRLDDPADNVFVEGRAVLGGLLLDAGRIEFDFVDPGMGGPVNTVSFLRMTGGTLQGAGDLDVDTLDWFGGTFAGSGGTRVLQNSEIDPRGPAEGFPDATPLTLDDRTLSLNAPIQSWNDGDLALSGTARLVLNSTLTGVFASPTLIADAGGTPRVIIGPSGILSTAGLGLTVEAPVDNAGIFSFTNDVDLLGGGASTGDFTLGAAATLGLDGDHLLSGALNVGGVGSTLEQRGGVTTLDGQFPMLTERDLPNVTVLGGTLELLDNGTSASLGYQYGTQALTVSGGSLSLGSTSVRALGAFDWTGGALLSSGAGISRVQIGPVATANWSGTGPKSIDGGLFYESLGETVWSAGDVTMSGGSSIRLGDQIQTGPESLLIVNGAPVTLRDGGGGTNSLIVFGGGGTLSHSGAGTATIEVRAAIGTGPSVTPPASLVVAGSELHLAGGGSHFGEVEVLGTLRLSDLSGSGHVFNSVSTLGLGGSGTVVFSNASSATTILGDYDIDRTFIDTGRVNFSSAGTAFTSTLDLFSGTLGGAGTVQVQSVLNWEPAGTMTGSGVTEIFIEGGQLNLLDRGLVANPTGRVLSGSRVISNDFRTTWTAGDLTIQDTAIFRTTADAQFVASPTMDVSILSGGGTPLFDMDNNSFFSLTTPQTVRIGVPVTNQGDSTVQAGTLAFSGGGTHAGQFVIADGARVRFDGGEFSIFGGTDFLASGMAATGVIELAAGVTNVLGELDIDFDNLLMTGGTLGGNGNARVTRSLDWQAGTFGVAGDFGATDILPGATGVISGPGAKAITGGYDLDNNGALTWSGGSIRVDSGSTLFTRAVPFAQMPQAASFDVALTAPGTIEGEGLFVLDALSTLSDASTAAATFGVRSDLAGAVTAAGSDLHFTRGNTYAGTFAVDGGLLRFSDVDAVGSTLDGSVTGAGTVAFSGAGTTTVATGATYDVGATLIDSGTVAFDATEANTMGLTLTDGTLDGAGTLVVSGTGLWNGSGTMLGAGTTQIGAGALLTIEGTAARALGGQRRLSSAGGIVWTGGDLGLDGDAAIVSSGDFLIDNAGALAMTTAGGAPLFFSSGAFAKTGAGTATIDVSSALEGTGSVDDGTLVFAAPVTQAATFTVTDPGVLRFAADASLGETGSLTGSGALEVTAGTLDLGTTAELSLGSLLVDGGSLDAASAALTLDSGLAFSAGSLEAASITVADGASSSLAGGSLTTGSLDLGTGSAVLTGTTLTVEGPLVAGSLSARSGVLASGTLDVDALVVDGGSISVAAGSDVATALTMNGGDFTTNSLSLAGGSTTQLSGGALAVTTTASADGLLTLAGGALSVGELLLGGTLAGNGTITGPVTNAGLVSAGASPGTIRIDGDFVQAASGRLLVELSGTTAVAGSDFDLLEITGSATLDGTLEFAALEDWTPTLGDTLLPITWGSVSGDFAEIVQPTPTAVFDPVVAATGLETTLVGLDGQFLDVGGGSVEAGDVAEEEGTTLEEIEGSQEVVELGREQRRTEQLCDEAKSPAESQGDGQQGVACRSI